MKIYTKTGDKGLTSLFGGKRVSKDDARIETCGTVDELNSLIGVVRSMKVPGRVDKILETVQNDLFVLGADLASPQRRGKRGSFVPRIGQEDVHHLEKTIDEIEPQLRPLRKFILPGGTLIAAHLHLARAVCRRAERLAVRLKRREVVGAQVIPYLNRLSDLLFILARWENMKSGVGEAPWR